MIASETINAGSFAFPAAGGQTPASTFETIDAGLQALYEHKDNWPQQSIAARLLMIDTLARDFAAIGQQWVDRVTEMQKISAIDHAIGSEWMGGPYAVLRYLRCLQQSLLDIQSKGVPQIPGPVKVRPNGQVTAQVFPQTFYDRLLFKGYTIEVWMDESVSLENLQQTQALAYRRPDPHGKVALVLGAGNVAGIPATDILDRLFIQNQVVIFKMNPVNDYLGPLFERGFRALIEAGVLRIVYGGVEQGAYLCQHSQVDEVLITGSDKTFEAIVFGSGEAGARRKAERTPLLDKPVHGELGNVTPVIIVPGEWSQEDLDYQAESVVSWIVGNASATCNTPRVIILHAEWPQREAFLAALRRSFGQSPLRYAYYPGSQARYQTFLAAHPEAGQIGEPEPGELPWTLIPDVDIRQADDICFTSEAFCSVVAAAPVSAADIPKYLQRAVEFANHTLWGNLAATIYVHPETLKAPENQAAVDQAVQDLRYGTIGVNSTVAVSWLMMTPTWGAYPGQDIYNIQSGNGFVHNALMFGAPQKAVVYAPFRDTPKPVAFVSRGKTLRNLGPLLTDLLFAPNPLKLPRILWHALSK